MIMTSLGCAVLAVLLAVRRPAARSLHSRLAPPTAAAGTDVYGKGRTPPRRSWTILTILIMLLRLINAAGYLGGSRAAVLATAAVLIMATVTRLVAQYRRRRSARQARADVAHACTAWPPTFGSARCHLLRCPLPPPTVMCFARANRHTHTLGGNVAAVWRQQAQRVGRRGLLELARAWQISMVQGLRHHAAAARDVRRSERQVLARAVGVRTIRF